MAGRGEVAGREGTVPPPVPPAAGEAWYAPAVRAQYELHPGVVATVCETGAGFTYEVREPTLPVPGTVALNAIETHFADAKLTRPRTREGAVERMVAGFEPKYREVIDRLIDCSAAMRRRVEYHALSRLRCLGTLTPYALDGRIEVADATGLDHPDTRGHRSTQDRPEATPGSDDDPSNRLVVHTADFAPATTAVTDPDPEFLERFASERLARYDVDFHRFSIPVVIYRERVLGTDPFETKYAVLEPDLLPGDGELIRTCKERIWEASVEGVLDDRAGFVERRARTTLSRLLTARHTRAWLDATAFRLRTALAAYGLAVPPVDSRFATDRLDDLVYYVLRDFVGYGQLTIPIRDPHLEDVEANRVGERIKVVPRPEVGHDERIPTNLVFEDETAFVNVVTQLAAADGTELSASTPSAKVNVDAEGVAETIRCAVALPTISEDGPHLSIRKQAPDVMTPVDLVDRGSLSTELVTLLWLLYEYRGVVLFSGPTGVGKTTLMNAHMPFIPYDDRPISIDEGSREVKLPHETGVSLTTRDHEHEYKRVTMADLMTESNYLNPDVEVIAEINTPASFETFAETLNTGHGVIGTTHAEDINKLVNRVVEQGLPAYLLRELDLVVFPRYVDGERYIGRVVELLTAVEYEALETPTSEERGVITKDGSTVHWNTVARRTPDGDYQLAYDHPRLGDETRHCRTRVFDRLAARTDQPVEAVEREFLRKHGYVEYLVQEDVSDFQGLFEFLADLRTDEAATVERATRTAHNQDAGEADGDDR